MLTFFPIFYKLGSYWITFYRHRHLDTISYCRDHHLNCTGLPDGIYEQPPKRFDPHYVICKAEKSGK